MTLKIDYPQKASAIPFIKNRQDCSWAPEVLKLLSIYAPEILLSGLLGIRISFDVWYWYWYFGISVFLI